MDPDKDGLWQTAKFGLPILLALAGAIVRAASQNIKGRKRTAALLSAAFCGVVLIPVSNVLSISNDWLLIIASTTGWVGGDVVLNSISKMALKKINGGQDGASE